MATAVQDYATLPPIQSDIKGFDGSPEGLLKAPPGIVVADKNTGKLYVKESAVTLATGWKIVTTT